MKEIYYFFIVVEYSPILNIIGDRRLVNQFNRKFVIREIIIQKNIGGHIFHHVLFRVHRKMYGFNIESFKFINKLPYLSLVVFQVIRSTINQIYHLTGDYLRVPEYLYTFDMQIQCLSESLHEFFILNHIVCTFKFQAACDHCSIAMQINEEATSTCSFYIPRTIKVQSKNVWVYQF